MARLRNCLRCIFTGIGRGFWHHQPSHLIAKVINKSRCLFPLPLAGLVWLVLLLGQMGLQAQEALRISMAGDLAAASRKQAANSIGYYNLLWGPLSLRCSANVSTEYTDNAGNSARSDGDLITRPSINTDLHWPVTTHNSLDVSVGAGYSFYARHSELDQFFLSPNSGISLDVYIGDWVFNVHDRASLTQNTYENPTTTNGVNSSYLQNNVGVSGMWDLNKALLNVGYDHADYMSLNTTSTSGQPDSASENFYLNAGLRPREEILFGVEGGLGLVSYDHGGGTNSLYGQTAGAMQLNGGVFCSLQLSEHFSARLDGGYTIFSPEQTAVTGTNAISNSSGLYFQMSLSHQVNAHVSYTLSAGHSVDYAYNGQPYDRYFVRLNPNWNFIYRWNFGTSVSWEHGTQVATGTAAGGLSYDQYNLGFNVNHQITQKLSAGMNYRWVMETANQAALNSTQNIVGLSLAYQF